MRSLGKTIDQILKIEPSLEEQLTPIKDKWERSPRRTPLYWKQFLTVLTNKIPPQHPKRIEIQKALTPKVSKKFKHTFEEPTSVETVIGPIPENLDGIFRRYDRQHVELAKRGVEAQMTHDRDTYIAVMRETEILETKQKKLWIDLKDHFKIWEMDGPQTFLIRIKGPLLVLTSFTMPQHAGQPAQSQPAQSQPAQGQPARAGSGLPSPSSGEAMPETFVIRMDPDMLKKFFKYFNITPPPGTFPD